MNCIPESLECQTPTDCPKGMKHCPGDICVIGECPSEVFLLNLIRLIALLIWSNAGMDNVKTTLNTAQLHLNFVQVEQYNIAYFVELLLHFQVVCIDQINVPNWNNMPYRPSNIDEPSTVFE